MNVRALLPRSLFVQLALLMVLSLSVLHLAAYVTMAFFAERYNIQNTLAGHNTTIAMCMRLLDPYSEKKTQRQLIAQSLSALPDLSINITRTAPPFQQSQDHLSLFLYEHLMTLLRDLATMPDAPHILRTQVELLNPDEEGPEKSLWQRLHDAVDTSRPFQAHIALQMINGEWLTINYQGKASNDQQNVPQLGLTLQTLLLACAVLFFIHRVMRPLRDLASAADAFGATMEPVAPVPLDGPAEVQRAAQAFNLMQQRILNGMEENARVFAALSHDLRTPLTRLRLRLEGVTPDELREKMLDDIRSLSSIVEDSTALMQVSRRTPSQDNTSTASPVRTDMQAFLEAIVEDRRDMGAEVNLESSLTCFAFIHPVPLRRCLDNLLDNALRYGKEVRVCAYQSTHPKRLHIDVLDNGPGLPEDCLEKVFEPFFRMEGSRSRETGGSGLGLSIARSMLQLHGGTVTLHNLASGGLCARIILPLSV